MFKIRKQIYIQNGPTGKWYESLYYDTKTAFKANNVILKDIKFSMTDWHIKREHILH